jgi:predicted lipoprotein with Yx(FWY)xxD motif
MKRPRDIGSDSTRVRRPRRISCWSFVVPLALSGALVLSTGAASSSAPFTVVTKTNSHLGKILADGQATMTLYTLTNNGSPVLCSGGCTNFWPPLTVPAGSTPTGGPGVNGLGTVVNANGTQVTANGLPLYHFFNDHKPADATGEGIMSFGGTWHAAKAGPAIIGRCTSVTGSTHMSPGLGHDKKAQTAVSPDTVSGAKPDIFSGCSQTGGGGPASATFTSMLTSTMPLACPAALGGPPDPPVGTVVLTGTTHIVWNSGPATDGMVKVKTTATPGRLNVMTKFTSGQFFLAGHTTMSKVTLSFTPNQASFNCTSPGNPKPLAHLNVANVGDAVTTRT